MGDPFVIICGGSLLTIEELISARYLKFHTNRFSVSDGLRTIELIPERISSVSFTLFRSFFLLEMLQ